MRVLRRTRRLYPDLTASIVGLGEPRPVPDGVTDLRTTKMNVETELAWCRTYAKSHFVIGVHGSNMLLPTALAGGCIEVLPHDRFGNLAQDVAVRCNDVMQLFLYRFVDEFASPATVAQESTPVPRSQTAPEGSPVKVTSKGSSSASTMSNVYDATSPSSTVVVAPVIARSGG